MGYEDNAFNSPAGIELLKQNFRLVFAPSTQDPTQIESKNLRVITKHFVDNTAQIINNIKRFAKGYTPIFAADAFESGIYVCPHCLRRDWMWLWDFKDMGYWDGNPISTGNLNFKTTTGLRDFRRNTYPTIVQVNCNDVYYCSDCSITQTNSGNCVKCNNSTTKVGCGKDSYTIHYTPPIENKTYNTTLKTSFKTTNRNWVKVNIDKFSQQCRYDKGILTAFEYKNKDTDSHFKTDQTGYVYGSNYNNFADKRNGIPQLLVGYSSPSLIKINNQLTMGMPEVKKYPISPMRMLMVPPPTRYRCNHKSHWRMGLGRSDPEQIKYRPLGESYWCDTIDPKTGRQHGKTDVKPDLEFNHSDMMECRITSPNPLPRDTTIQSELFGGKPIYRITLQYENNLRYQPKRAGWHTRSSDQISNWNSGTSRTTQKSLYLPMAFTLMPIPEDVEKISFEMGGREPCPNDPAIEEILGTFNCDSLVNGELPEDVLIDKSLTVKKLIDEGRQDIVDTLNDYASGLIDNKISPLILENTSNRGILLNKKYRGWIDLSDPIINLAGKEVPRQLFLNNKIYRAKSWLREYCRDTLFNSEIAPRGVATQGLLGYNASLRPSHRNFKDFKTEVLHKPNAEWLESTRHLEAAIIPMIVGTKNSITTNQSPWSDQFVRKLKGTEIAGSQTPMKPFVTSSSSSFLPMTLVARTTMPVAGIGGTATKAVTSEIKDKKMLHHVDIGLNYVDDSTMTSYTVLRCDTCNEIVDAGGVLPYRIGLGEVDESGKVTGTNRMLTQEYFDREVAHEANDGGKYKPYITNDGVTICPAWGIDFPSAHKFGKEMLLGGSTTSLTIGVRTK
jgi:hypothetical protein